MSTTGNADDPEWVRSVLADAARHRAAMDTRRADAHTVTTDVYTEAGCAWLSTGLVHETYTGADIDEISAAIADRVAVSMTLAGWTPPGGAG